jgi:hypothetical protein
MLDQQDYRAANYKTIGQLHETLSHYDNANNEDTSA